MNLTSLEETQQLAQDLVGQYVPFVAERPLVIGINGPLGAGKTTFTQAIAKTLDISETVTSPTYTYLEEYPFVFPGFKGMLYHLDAWRIEEEVVFEQLKISDLVRPSCLVVIEWFDQIEPWLEKTLIERNARLVTVNLTHKKDLREVEVTVCEYGESNISA